MIRVTDMYEDDLEGCALTKNHTYSYISVHSHLFVYVLVYGCPILNSLTVLTLQYLLLFLSNCILLVCPPSLLLT